MTTSFSGSAYPYILKSAHIFQSTIQILIKLNFPYRHLRIKYSLHPIYKADDTPSSSAFFARILTFKAFEMLKNYADVEIFIAVVLNFINFAPLIVSKDKPKKTIDMKKTLLSALKHGSGILLTLFSFLCACQVWADYTFTLYMYSPSSPAYIYFWDSSENPIGNTYPGTAWGSFSKTSLGNNWYKSQITSPTLTYSTQVNCGSGDCKSGDVNGLSNSWIKANGNTDCKDYGIPSDYKTVKSGGLLDNRTFSSFDESKQAFKYELSNISAGTYYYRVYNGSTEYWSTINNSRGNVTLSGGKSGSTNNDVSFTLSGGNKNITIYYDPGADVTFVDAVEACTTPTVGAVSGDVATEECEGTVELSVSPTGGTEPLSYQWFKNNTQSTSGGTAVTGKTSSNTYTPLSGSYYYYCEVYSAGECEAIYHASSSPTTNRVNIKDAPVVTASATVITNYTPVVVSAAGPNVVWTKDVKSGTDENSYLYKPTNSSVIFKGKGTSGTVVYTVTGTAENGCSSSVDISVSQDVDICQ